MKVGILGDIHGNICALDAVLSSARRLGVERLLVTGDLVGYYFHPSEVLSALDEWNCTIVRGNHEDMLTRGRKDPAFLDSVDVKYGCGIRVALESLESERLEYLERLPLFERIDLGGHDILLCHGSPWDTDDYVYPDSSAATFERCASYGAKIVLMGHTHYPMNQRIDSCQLINPGSVGQPRDRRTGAAWAVFDTETGVAQMRVESYDVSSVVNECVLRHPELPYLANVLNRS